MRLTAGETTQNDCYFHKEKKKNPSLCKIPQKSGSWNFSFYNNTRKVYSVQNKFFFFLCAKMMINSTL